MVSIDGLLSARTTLAFPRGMFQVCRWLELGLVVDWKDFPGFREAFDTGEVAWDIDPAPFRKRAEEVHRGKHGQLYLSSWAASWASPNVSLFLAPGVLARVF